VVQDATLVGHGFSLAAELRLSAAGHKSCPNHVESPFASCRERTGLATDAARRSSYPAYFVATVCAKVVIAAVTWPTIPRLASTLVVILTSRKIPNPGRRMLCVNCLVI